VQESIGRIEGTCHAFDVRNAPGVLVVLVNGWPVDPFVVGIVPGCC